MGERVKILHIISGMGNGGAETFLMNMYRNMDRTKIQFDFLLSSSENAFKEELESYGSEIFVVTKYTQNPIKSAIETARFFKEHSYSIVHIHANSLMNLIPLIITKRAGIPCRIMHSHSTRVIHKVFFPLHLFHKMFITQLATDNLACSNAAGKWMFPGEYIVVNNAIDTSKYRYDSKARSAIRESLGIDDETVVIGHVGRFFPAKNHAFILDVFEEILHLKGKTQLLLVGDGGQENEVRRWVQQRELENNVQFLGMRMDANKILSAFDVFLFPSIYEGLSLALLEAQVNGLQIFSSTNISEENTVTSTVHRLSLKQGADYWAKTIMSTNLTRKDGEQIVINAGFDIRTEAQKLQQFYLDKAQRRNLI